MRHLGQRRNLNRRKAWNDVEYHDVEKPRPVGAWECGCVFIIAQTDIERNLYCKAALRMDQGVEFPEPEAAGAKYYGTNCAAEMAREAVQIFGGYGFMDQLAHDQSTYKVEEIYRDCKISEIYEGTNEIQKMIIARTIFGKEI